MPESTRVSASESKTPAHVSLAVVFQVRAGKLQALLWQRAKDPDAGAWSLPGGYLDAGRDARAVDPPAPRREGRRSRAVAPRAARDAERPTPASEGVAARDGVPRHRPARGRSRSARGHELALGRPAARACVRPSGDHARRPRPTAGEALLHEHRLRARAGDVHAERAPRHLRGRAGPRRLGDEPPARPRPPRRPRGDRRASRTGTRGRQARCALPLQHAEARGHGPVRRAQAAGTLSGAPLGAPLDSLLAVVSPGRRAG